ncbi:MAG: hypothetical protein ACI9HE_004080 [Planctomycetota bacterium]|jgi:hypothetical protein
MALERGLPKTRSRFRNSKPRATSAFCAARRPGVAASVQHRPVTEEDVLDRPLPMVGRLLLPSPAACLAYPQNGLVPCSGPRLAARHGCRPRWGDDYSRSARTGLVVDDHRAVGRVSRDAGQLALGLLDDLEPRSRIVARTVRQDLRTGHPPSIIADVQLAKTSLSTPSKLSCGPFAFSDEGQPRAIDDQVDRVLR